MRHTFLVVTVKRWLKSVYIYGSYRKIKTGVPLFWITLYMTILNSYGEASDNRIYYITWVGGLWFCYITLHGVESVSKMGKFCVILICERPLHSPHALLIFVIGFIYSHTYDNPMCRPMYVMEKFEITLKDIQGHRQ